MSPTNMTSSEKSKPVLGYWNIRGIAQPIRLILTYAGVDFDDKRYSLENGGRQWYKEKNILGLDFPNIPYYINGEVKLTQSFAIMQHLARAHNLDGKTEEEKNRISLAEQQIGDINKSFWNVLTDPTYPNSKPDYLKTLAVQLGEMSKFLGAKPFLAGISISYVDFMLYEYLLRIYKYAQEEVEKYKNLEIFLERIESLPRVSSYIKKQKPSPFVTRGLNWYAEY